MNNWTLFHARLDQTLRQRKLLQRGDSLLVAVSGGQDSLCLIKLLLDLRHKWHWQIAIAHCDHRWSTDEGIADHVQQIAYNWQLPFFLKTASNLKETEANAREWRYKVLIEIAQAQGFNKIITGHTQSDRAETFLYNLMRGAGADGLQALTWKRSLTENIQLIRPLLNISRGETLAFCQQFQLPIWEDEANNNLNYARNRIRNHLLPYIKDYFNPQIEKKLAQTAEILQAETLYLEDTARQIFDDAFCSSKQQLNRIYLRQYPLALQRRVIKQFLQQSMGMTPNFEQIEAVTNLIKAPNKSRTSSLFKGISAEVEGNWINLTGK